MRDRRSATRADTGWLGSLYGRTSAPGAADGAATPMATAVAAAAISERGTRCRGLLRPNIGIPPYDPVAIDTWLGDRPPSRLAVSHGQRRPPRLDPRRP